MSQSNAPASIPTAEPVETHEASPVTTVSTAPGRAGEQVNMRQRLTRIALTLAILVSIAGAAWYVGEQQGWAQIGGGGINATLLPRVGEPAPELFTLRADGTPVLLSQLRGQPVWVKFWGSWCPPCRAEMPDVERAYDTLAAQGLQVLAVTMQEPLSEAVRYAESVGGNMPIYADPNQVASMIDPETQPELAAKLDLMTQDWQIANFPTHVFIDADGIIRAVVISPLTYEEAVSYGEMVINQPSG